MDEFDEIVEDIKAIRIQGARNVAKYALRALALKAREIKANTPSELLSELLKTALFLSSLRPTEPMLRNYIEETTTYFVNYLSTLNDVEEIKERAEALALKFIDLMEKQKEELSLIGANYMPDEATIITYCHSSTATSIIKKAVEMGKEIRVYACETRPLYQGRITAKELSEAGIDTTLIVDGAMARYASKADLALVGADAITSTGDLVNKIGTLSLAIVMRSYNKPLFSAAEIFKYDPFTAFGFREPIEMRSAEEVWKNAPSDVKILNPAFDLIPNHLITAYITDRGILAPSDISKAFEEAKGQLFSH